MLKSLSFDSCCNNVILSCFRYTILNDVTARDLQKRHQQVMPNMWFWSYKLRSSLHFCLHYSFSFVIAKANVHISICILSILSIVVVCSFKEIYNYKGHVVPYDLYFYRNLWAIRLSCMLVQSSHIILVILVLLVTSITHAFSQSHNLTTSWLSLVR